jgi:lipase chaperone LimK
VKRRILWFIPVVFLGLWAAEAWRHRASPEAVSTFASSSLSVNEPRLSRRVERDSKAALAAPSSSLQDTAVDGEIETDASGLVLATRSLRRRFDYFLSQFGDTLQPLSRQVADISTIRMQVVASVSEKERLQVLDLFDRYVIYQTRVLDLITAQGAMERLAQLHELRVISLGQSVADAFFAEEERGDLAALQKALPINHSLLEDFHAHEKVAANLSEDDLRRERAAVFGPDVAERLKTLDMSRSAWNARIRTFEQAKARIAAEPQLSPEVLNQKTDELRASLFSPNEVLRVKAMETISLSPRPSPFIAR